MNVSQYAIITDQVFIPVSRRPYLTLAQGVRRLFGWSRSSFKPEPSVCGVLQGMLIRVQRQYLCSAGLSVSSNMFALMMAVWLGCWYTLWGFPESHGTLLWIALTGSLGGAISIS